MAIVGGALLLFTRSVKADKVYREIDWPLLVMFVGLFIVVTGLEMTVLTPETIGAGISAMPWWAPLAGLTGAVAVFAGLAFIDEIGAGPVNGLIIMANLFTSLAIEHFGLMNRCTP